MLVSRVFVVIGLLVFFSSEFGLADPTYGKVGDSVVLNPGKTSDPITSVTWKHQLDLALEWFRKETTCYRTFNGRCDLDETTGSFTIRLLTVEDSGEYTPEINNRVLSKKELKVIKPVPKPTVSKACNSDQTDCNLTCEADVTSGFGPVTYEWKAEEKLSTNKTLNITGKNKERSFLCILSNPVSSSTSQEFPNPTSRGNNFAALIVLAVLAVLVLGVFVLIGFILNRKGRLPWLDKIFPCNEKARPQGEYVNSTSVQIPEDQNQEDAVNATLGEGLPLLPNGTKTNQTEALVTPNGELHQVSQENETLDGETAEINSKGKEALNGRQPADDGEPNDPTGNPSVDQVFSQESHPDPSAANPEPSSQTGKNKVTETSDSKVQDQPSETNRIDEGESGQNSNSEEPEPAAEGPGKPDDSTCNPSVVTQPEQVSSHESHPNPEPSTETENNSNGKEALSGDLLANINEDDSKEQDSPSETNDEGESGQNSNSEEPDPAAEGPENSPLESSIEETPEPDFAES